MQCNHFCSSTIKANYGGDQHGHLRRGISCLSDKPVLARMFLGGAVRTTARRHTQARVLYSTLRNEGFWAKWQATLDWLSAVVTYEIMDSDIRYNFAIVAAVKIF